MTDVTDVTDVSYLTTGECPHCLVNLKARPLHLANGQIDDGIFQPTFATCCVCSGHFDIGPDETVVASQPAKYGDARDE